MKEQTIGFIGGGNMAASLIGGLIADGIAAKRIWVSDVDSEKLKRLEEKFGIHPARDNKAVVAEADVVVLAVKPQIMQAVAESLRSEVERRRPLVISIAAGIREADLEKWLGDSVHLVRCMPNTPALVRTGATALHANRRVGQKQRDLAETILRAVGVALWVEEESLLDVVTALSGSGPAYYFLLMEAMEKAAIGLGLNEATARLLTQQTALGAAKMALEAAESPADLRRKVTSPGGTTQRAVETFEQGGFTALVEKALSEAKERSIELSMELGER